MPPARTDLALHQRTLDVLAIRALVNPSLKQLRKAIREIQRGCRRNLLTTYDLHQLVELSTEPGFFSDRRGLDDEVSPYYRHDVASTQAQAVWLGAGLTGYVMQRVATSPGDTISPPLYPGRPGERGFMPLIWLENVLWLFAGLLTNEQVEYLRQWASQVRPTPFPAVARTIEPSQLTEAELEERRRQDQERRQRIQELRERFERRRQEEQDQMLGSEQRRQLNILSFCRGVLPTFRSYLVDRCQHIAAVLEAEQRQDVSWREFKQRWQHVATAYADQLVPLLHGTRIRRLDLLAIEDPQPFTLSFRLWRGAQRLNRHQQLVVRIDGEEVLDRAARIDKDCERVVSDLRFSALLSSHPVTENTVGWLRVHLDHSNHLAFVDECQSDMLEQLRQLRRQGDSAALSNLEDDLRGWPLDGFASIRNWARELGYRAGIHSPESASRKPGMTKSTRKWRACYQAIIERFGLVMREVPWYLALIYTEGE